jgi:hypothetical protein
LAKVLLSFDPDHPLGYDSQAYKNALCEWDILGQSGQETYIWVNCISANGLDLRRNPVVIYLAADGSIRDMNVHRLVVNHPALTGTYDLHLFPIDIQEKLCLYYFSGNIPQCSSIVPDYTPRYSPFDYPQSRESVLLLHLEHRRKSHADEPPLIVLSALPTATPTP